MKIELMCWHNQPFLFFVYVLPYVFDTIGLLCKLLDRVSIKSERSRIAQDLLDGKIKDESEFFDF
jgi:hypothetical protein